MSKKHRPLIIYISLLFFVFVIMMNQYKEPEMHHPNELIPNDKPNIENTCVDHLKPNTLIINNDTFEIVNNYWWFSSNQNRVSFTNNHCQFIYFEFPIGLEPNTSYPIQLHSEQAFAKIYFEHFCFEDKESIHVYHAFNSEQQLAVNLFNKEVELYLCPTTFTDTINQQSLAIEGKFRYKELKYAY